MFSTATNRLSAYRAERAQVLAALLSCQARLAQLDEAIALELDIKFYELGLRLDAVQLEQVKAREMAGG